MDNNEITPYYLSLGEKLVKDLDGLELLRALYPQQYQAMAEYLGGVIQDEVKYAVRSHERSTERRARLAGHIFEEPMNTKAFKKNLESATWVQYAENGGNDKIGYGANSLIASSTPVTGSPYVANSQVLCRCGDNHFCPIHDVQGGYTDGDEDLDFGPHITYHPNGLEDDGSIDMTTPEGQAKYQRDVERNLWEIVTHPNFLALDHKSGGWVFTTVWSIGGTAPTIEGIIDTANECLFGDNRDYD